MEAWLAWRSAVGINAGSEQSNVEALGCTGHELRLLMQSGRGLYECISVRQTETWCRRSDSLRSGAYSSLAAIQVLEVLLDFK